METETETELLSPRVRRIKARVLPIVQKLSQKSGLRYENNVEKNLRKIANAHGGILEHNPWFEYLDDDNELRVAVPDFILEIGYCVLVIETKLTWTPRALDQLGKYVPMVRNFMPVIPRRIVRGVVMCKSLIPDAREFPEVHRLSQMFSEEHKETPYLQWLGRGEILW